MSADLEVTERSRLRRTYERGHFDRPTINKVLDAHPMCSVGYIIDGKPFVTPTLQWREGNHIYWHGSSASRALRKARNTQVCLTVSILDGFVLARSGMHHSVNFRSAMLFGTTVKVESAKEKLEKLGNFLNGLYPGQYDTLQTDYEQDLKATMILGMEINEGSAKIHTGGPVDEDEDYDLPIWAGVIPISTQIGEPIPDPSNLNGVEMPDHVRKFQLDG